MAGGQPFRFRLKPAEGLEIVTVDGAVILGPHLTMEVLQFLLEHEAELHALLREYETNTRQYTFLYDPELRAKYHFA